MFKKPTTYFFIVFIALTALLLYAAVFLSGGVVAYVNPLTAARITMKGFAEVAVGIPESERAKCCNIEQFYLHLHPEDPTLKGFYASGSSWSFVDYTRSLKYSYLVYPNSNGSDPKKAVFIATPCEIVITPGKQGRVLLTHSLDIVTLDEPSFHAQIASQMLSR